MKLIFYYNTEKNTKESIMLWFHEVNDIINLSKCKVFKSKKNTIKILPLDDRSMGYRCDYSFFPRELRGTDKEKIALCSTINKIIYY